VKRASERWARIGALFHEWVDAADAEREAAIDRLAGEAPELAEELRRLFEADRRAAASRTNVPERDAETAAPVERCGAYRLVAELARGGMGVVYLAERADGAFDRRVAVKRVRPDLAAPELAARFAAERRILASLDHPGIARLLDAGTDEGGAFYLVLELVEGERLDRWCVARGLDERLRIFLAVCDAVEHAHRSLVLHRDLKPANILVTAESGPKLLDFGIARLLETSEAGGESTRFGARPLTPDYASPEQLRGEPLTTASDLFSLGVLLFEVVTGERPFQLPVGLSPEERARRMTTAASPRPSAVLRHAPSGPIAAGEVAGDLDAIVAKLLAGEPAARYRSAGELAADLRCHLEGRPVEARLPSAIERGVKFARRHRAAAVASFAALLALAAATAISIRQAAIARSERDRAERRFADVRELARSLLFEIHEAVRDLDGATRARELIVARALDYFGRLAREAAQDPTLQRELATGYEQIAEIQGASGQGASLGRIDDAVASMRAAIALRERLARAADSSREDRAALFRARDRLASIEISAGRYGEGRREAERAFALAEELLAERPDAEDSLDFVAAAGQRLGVVPGVGMPESSKLLSRAVELRRRLLAARPDLVERREKLAEALRLAATALGDLGPGRALDLLGEAVDLREAVLRERPASLAARTELIKALLAFGAVLARSRPDAAMPPLERASALAASAAEADRANLNLLGLRMGLEGEVATTHRLARRLDDALRHQELHVALLEEFVRSAEGYEADDYVAGSYLDLGEIRWELAAGAVGRDRIRHLRAAREAFARTAAVGRGRRDGVESTPLMAAALASAEQRLAAIARELPGD
jgi:hypothetical protein